MTGTIQAFESSRQKTNLWLKQVAAELHSDDRRKAYAALRAVLHLIRDCLPVEETAKFAAQMPLLLQGVLFEGWKPRRKPQRLTRTEFFQGVRECTRNQPGLDAALTTRAVLVTLARHLSAGEIEAVRRVLPHEVRDLWYELGHHRPTEPAEAAVSDAQPQAEPHGETMAPDAFRAYEPGSKGAPAWP